MENNITKIPIKNSGKGVWPSPWIAEKEGMTLPLQCSLSLMTLPSEAPTPPSPLPPPKKKRTFPYKCNEIWLDYARSLLKLFSRVDVGQKDVSLLMDHLLSIKELVKYFFPLP